MKMFSAMLALYEENPPVTGYTHTGLAMWSFDVSFDISMNKLLNKQSIGR